MTDTTATDPADYVPPKVWTWNKDNGGRFANINRPIAGPTHDKELPVGRHPLQLYSLATPNGVKVTVMLEELLALGPRGRRVRRLADPHQRGRPVRQRLRRRSTRTPRSRRCWTAAGRRRSGCSSPARSCCTWPRSSAPSCRPSGAARAECLSWLFWQMGSAPFLGGGFGHFYAYAPTQDRIRDRPLRDGGQAPARRARPAPGRQPTTWPATTTRSPTWRSGPGTARWPRACSTAPASSCRCRTTRTSSAGPTQIAAAPGRAARPHGQPHLGRAGQPAARAPRRQRLRHPDAGQGRRAGQGAVAAGPERDHE